PAREFVTQAGCEFGRLPDDRGRVDALGKWSGAVGRFLGRLDLNRRDLDLDLDRRDLNLDLDRFDLDLDLSLSLDRFDLGAYDLGAYDLGGRVRDRGESSRF